MTPVDIIEITEAADQKDAFAIRQMVFCEEQQVDSDLEFDGLDDDCRQYLARWNGLATGTARIRDTGNGGVKIERVAVLASHRNKGIGKALMLRTMEDARAKGAVTIAINAQCHAEVFYRALGFNRIGDIFDEADIPHVRMELES